MLQTKPAWVLGFALLFVAVPLAAHTSGQALLAGIHLAISDSDQFHTRDVGLGGRLSWQPNPLIGVEGELTIFSDVFSDGVAFSDGRVEGLFGATIGPRFGAVRAFAKVRPGFLRYRAADEPIPCIAIFPPPLSCTLAGGRTLFALDLGGGVEIFPSRRTFVRVDVGDRMVRFPASVIDTSGQVRQERFTGHDVRFAFGGGVRF